jgi:hypothetical protein
VIAAPQALETEMLIGLGEALASMPESQRTAILLREWQGLSYAEIAREMSLTNGAVETLIFRARRTLAKGLEDEPSRRKKIVGGLNVGSLASALKGLLGGAGAAKLAAAGTVAVVATVAAQPLAHRLAPPSGPSLPAGSLQPAPGEPPGAIGRGAEIQRNMASPATALRTAPSRTVTLAPRPPAPQKDDPRNAAADAGAGVVGDGAAATPLAPTPAENGVTNGATPQGADVQAGGSPSPPGKPEKADTAKGGKSDTASSAAQGTGANGQTQTPSGQAKKAAAPEHGKTQATPAQETKPDTGSAPDAPATSNAGGNEKSKGDGNGTQGTQTGASPTETTPATDTHPGNNGDAANADGTANAGSTANANPGDNASTTGEASTDASSHGKA